MNGSLVAFYGATPKPPVLHTLTADLQGLLLSEPRLPFTPYEPGQVHATVVGLEGKRVGERLISSNWAGQRGGIRLLDLKGVIEVIRSSRNLPLSLRFGGFDVARESSFSSRGLHPGIRSFSIQARIAVAMGWPVVGDAFPPAIDLLRRELAPVGALHKYHVSEGEIDNDFFFVLGQVERRGLEKTVVAEVQQRIRHFLSSREVDIHLRRDDLSLVAYEETTLALTRTRQFSLDDIAADPMLMINLYDAAV